MRRRPLILLVGFLLLTGCAGEGLRLGDDIPADLGELVDGSFAAIRDDLAAHADCLAGLTVTHSWEMEDRAFYEPAAATIVLRVPATASELEFSLAHEIAHHLEEACPAQAELRPAFLRAQGLPATAAWFEGETWESTPSEQFATALGLAITGDTDPSRRVPLTEEAAALVREWMAGG